MTVNELFQGFTIPRRVTANIAESDLLSLASPCSIQHGDLVLEGWRWGSSGPKVLLVHGWDSRASHLGRFVAPLTGAGFQVWAFDAPAHGESGGTTSSVIHYGRALLTIARACGPFDGLIAHSVGSPAALYAFRHGMRVKSSVHIAGPSSLARVIDRMGEAAGLDLRQLEQFRSMVEAHTGESIAGMELRHLAQALDHPGLLLHDPADREIPISESALLERAWTQARLIEIQDAGHRRIIAHPYAIRVAVEHLTSTIPVTSGQLAGSTQ